MRTAFITFFAVVVAMAAAGLAQTKPTSTDPSRLLKSFDFEERAMGNNEDQPMQWEKLQGVNLPHYVLGRLTTDRHRSGEHSFRMDLDGSSCVYRYQPGLLKVHPGTHYRFEAYCQTTPLRFARARITAYFTDQDLHPLSGTVKHSELYTNNGEEDPDNWHLLSVELTASADEAAFMVVQMELLQPDLYSSASLGKRTLFLQDVHGSAWFDDLTISQVPQILLKTDRPCNVFRQGDPLKLTVQVNDRQTDDLSVQLQVNDAVNRRVYQHTGTVDLSSAKTISNGVQEMSLDLPNVAPGWYRASLLMMSHGVYVGQESLAWVLLADGGEIVPPDNRFGVTATDLKFENWTDLPGFLPLMSVGRVKLPLWSKTDDVQTVGSEKLDRLLESIQQQNISPIGCLLALPPGLSNTLNGSEWLQLLSAPVADWQTQLSFLISQHANRIDRWQLGADETDEFAANPDMRKAYNKIVGQFSNLIDRPAVAMPCPIIYELPQPLPTTLCLSVPASILPSEIPLYVSDFSGRDQSSITLSLGLLDAQRYSRNAQISDMAERIVYCLSSDVARFDLPIPMVVHHQGDGTTAEPQELAIIMRTLLANLSGAVYRGRLPIAADIDAFLFEKNSQGVVVLWNRNEVAEPRFVSSSLGERTNQKDLWGNSIAVMQSLADPEEDTGPRKSTRAASVELKVGSMPTILTGVDIDMCRLRSSLSFDQPLIESSFQSHVRHIRFINPYSQPIGGTLKLRAPAGWNLVPSSFDFTLNAGQSFDRELTVEFPYNSIAGMQPVDAQFDLQADRHVRFAEPLALKLGLSDVGSKCMAFRDGNDAVIQQMITNYGEQPITYSAFASCPGRPRIERLVTSLSPGQTSIKKYRFIGLITDHVPKVRVGLKEVDGNRILNDEVEIK